MNRYLFGLFLTITLISCQSTGKLIDLSNTGEEQLRTMIADHEYDYEWAIIKGDVSIETDEFEFGFKIQIRMLNDKLIWMSGRKLGIEIFRTLVTPDSLFGLDKFNKLYLAESVQIVEELFKLPPDFHALENIILGYPYLPDGNFDILKGKELKVKSNFKDVSYSYILDPKRLNLISASAFLGNKISLSLEQSEFQSLKKHGEIPYFRSYSMADGSDQSKVFLQIKEIDLKSQGSAPFKIPDHYEPWN